MASTNLKSIPFFSDDWVKQLNEAGYFTTDSLQNETAEQLIKKLSFRNKSNNFTLDICKMIIDFSKRTMEEYPKQNAFEITSNFFDENDLQDWSEFEKKSALEFLSLELFQNYDAGIADFDNSNIFLINTSDNIDLLTKKSIFLPTIPTISFQNNNSIIQIDHQQGYDIETGEEGEYQFFVICQTETNQQIGFGQQNLCFNLD